MKYRLFELVKAKSTLESDALWISESMDVPPGKNMFDSYAHIKATVHAGFINGSERGAIGEDGFAFALDASGNEINRITAVEKGLFPADMALLNTTIYASPGGAKNVMLIPYPMKQGQSPSDINPAYHSDWKTIAQFNGDNTGLLYLAPVGLPIKADISELSQGEFFQINLSNLRLDESLYGKTIDPAWHEIYRKDTDEFVGVIRFVNNQNDIHGGWKVMPANGSFVVGGAYLSGDKSSYPARSVKSLMGGVLVMNEIAALDQSHKDEQSLTAPSLA